MIPAWNKLHETIRKADTIRPVGRVTNLVGMVIEVEGLASPVGSLCRINAGRHEPDVLSEVIGFRDDTLLVMPYQHTRGIATGCRVDLVARAKPVSPRDRITHNAHVKELGNKFDAGIADVA